MSVHDTPRETRHKAEGYLVDAADNLRACEAAHRKAVDDFAKDVWGAHIRLDFLLDDMVSQAWASDLGAITDVNLKVTADYPRALWALRMARREMRQAIDHAKRVGLGARKILETIGESVTRDPARKLERVLDGLVGVIPSALTAEAVSRHMKDWSRKHGGRGEGGLKNG